MTGNIILPRRRFLGGVAAGAGGLLLSGCDALNRNESFNAMLDGVEDLNRVFQRGITSRNALAREYEPEDMSPFFRTNGNATADTDEYRAMLANGFADWRLRVEGMVERPLAISLAQLQAMPQRAQITRHDCVEGWSAIGKWQGPQLSHILRIAGLSDNARYILFRCADDFSGTRYYESIDLVDAFHPQTIMAWSMNDGLLPEGHGAPVRLRVERQLGYKHAKFVMRIQAVDSLDNINGGKGGYWEDVAGYQWYAGI